MQSARNLKHIGIMFQRIMPCNMKGKAKVWIFDSGSEWGRASESGRDGPLVGIQKPVGTTQAEAERNFFSCQDGGWHSHPVVAILVKNAQKERKIGEILNTRKCLPGQLYGLW